MRVDWKRGLGVDGCSVIEGFFGQGFKERFKGLSRGMRGDALTCFIIFLRY